MTLPMPEPRREPTATGAIPTGAASSGSGSSASGSAFAPTPPGIAAPGLSLPKPGGAIRGIGEKFAANPATGTGSLSVPIATSPGRSGFGPQLTLGYDSGTGNGPFGFGWSLALPAVTRRTDKGLPRYDGSDVFLLSDAEDLVVALDLRARRLAAGQLDQPGPRARIPHRPVPAAHRGTVRPDRTMDRPFRRRHPLAVGDPGQRRQLVRPGFQLARGGPGRPDAGVQLAAVPQRGRPGQRDQLRVPRGEQRRRRSGAGARAPPQPAGADGQPLHQADPVRQPGVVPRRSRPGGPRLDVRGRVRLRRTRPGRAHPRRGAAAAVPGRPVLLLPRGLRGAHLPAVPAGADVPPLPG